MLAWATAAPATPRPPPPDEEPLAKRSRFSKCPICDATVYSGFIGRSPGTCVTAMVI
jgi:hypothetical protein